MSSASLATHRAHPDSARIASISAAIALNLAVILIASRPIIPVPFHVARQLAPVPLIHIIEPPPAVQPPPPVQLQPLPHPQTVIPPQSHPRTLPTHQSVVVPTTEGTVAATPTTPSVLPDNTVPGTSTVSAPVEASLAYRTAPLHFPLQALRQRMHGTVLLRVLVDETGKPLQVTVEHGSGYALLDRIAREQVLAGWRFQPAMVDGRAVRAWAMVPVDFDLRGE